MEFSDVVALSARMFEAAGIAAMVVGAVAAVLAVFLPDRRVLGFQERYRLLRQDLGSAILLGLELLVAADILRTVTESPTLQQVMILGLIVVIRTFLSFTLEVEIDGKWPWQRSPRGEPRPPKI